ncbi:MAG TPA: gamma-glutamyltransferase [Dongiaceae bacterium]|nr:gamma-glutamyltransferase [Dongiaceae bacterium]
MRDFQFPGRSPVRTTEAMAATSHPLASAAALQLLRNGGNAVDAAICAAAVLAVVEPQSTGIGGDCFALYVPKGASKPLAFNGSGRSPAAAKLDWYLEHGFTAVPTYGPHAVTVPGAIDAWCQLHADHGSKDFAEILAPAIHYAENGYVVHDRVSADWHETAAQLAVDPHAKRILLPGGVAPRAGDVHRQPELAATLRLIAKEGRRGFYEGTVAADMVDYLRSLGGLHQLSDFAATKGDYVTPVTSSYRGVDLFQLPPNNQGLTALLMLNILSGFDLGALDPLGAERLHLEVEAGRLAYRDRDAFIADPTHEPVPVEKLLSQDYAARLIQRIDRQRAATDLPPPLMEASDTVYLSMVDRDRNAISFINSTYYSFGSGLVSPKSGVVLQNRGSSFKLDPRHPNCIAPNKRPMHTIMPGFAMKDGKALMPYGVMGGDYQPFGHVHFLTNVLDFGLDPQAALDLSRVFYSGGRVQVERSLPAASIAGLQDRGHAVEISPEPLGGGQAIRIDWQKGTLTGGSDPRKDGCAIGY